MLIPGLHNFPRFREEHTALDKRLVDEQKKSSKHYNPVKKTWRYRLIDKSTGKYYRFTRIRQITRNTSFIDQFEGKYEYRPWPYAKYSLLKVWWFLIQMWRSRSHFFDSAVKSPFTRETWIIFRSVVVLLIAYVIWDLFKKDILKMFY